jgi:hypothetical protein
MSDHESHGHSHDSHSKGHDGHDEHGHGNGHNGHNGHEEQWGDYNSAPLEPSQLPPVSPALLIAFGTALTFLLCMIVASSFMLATADEGRPHVEAEAGQHESGAEKSEKQE